MLVRGGPGRAGAHSGPATHELSGVGIEASPLAADVVLNGAWPPGGVCPVASGKLARTEETENTN